MRASTPPILLHRGTPLGRYPSLTTRRPMGVPPLMGMTPPWICLQREKGGMMATMEWYPQRHHLQQGLAVPSG